MPTRKPCRFGIIATLLATLASAGCAGSVRPTYVPDGRRGFVVTCGGALNDWSTCLVKAGRACGNHGYDTIRGTEEDRSLLIACKVPPIPPPSAP
jgi:hypothetical protein